MVIATRAENLGSDAIAALLRAMLEIGGGDPKRVARIDPHPPSMGGLVADEPDEPDGVPSCPPARSPIRARPAFSRLSRVNDPRITPLSLLNAGTYRRGEA